MVHFAWAQVVVFDERSKPPIRPDDILDTPPSRLRLGLQPYLSPLDLDYAVAQTWRNGRRCLRRSIIYDMIYMRNQRLTRNLNLS